MGRVSSCQYRPPKKWDFFRILIDDIRWPGQSRPGLFMLKTSRREFDICVSTSRRSSRGTLGTLPLLLPAQSREDGQRQERPGGQTLRGRPSRRTAAQRWGHDPREQFEATGGRGRRQQPGRSGRPREQRRDRGHAEGQDRGLNLWNVLQLRQTEEQEEEDEESHALSSTRRTLNDFSQRCRNTFTRTLSSMSHNVQRQTAGPEQLRDGVKTTFNIYI